MRWGVWAAGPVLLTAISLAAAQSPPATPPPSNLSPAVDAKAETPPVDQQFVPGPTAKCDSNCDKKWTDNHQGPCERLWFGGGYRLMWIKDGPQTFPLAVIGNGAAVIGGQDIDFGTFTAGAVNGGLWLNDRHTFGLYAGGFMTEQRSVINAIASDPAGNPQIIRPFIDGLTVTPSGLFVAQPGVFAGTFMTKAESQLAGLEAGTLWNVAQSDSWTINFLYGTRYLDLEENLAISQQTTQIGAPALPPLGVADRFQTRNQFVGGQVGTYAEYRFGSFAAGVASKVSLGNNHEVIGIIGQTTGIGPADGIRGGLLAVPGGNAGRIEFNRFVVVPEVGVNFGWQATSWLRLNVSYDFLYINDVARPGSQIDPFVNPKLVPVSAAFGSTSGPNFPAPTAKSDTFWAQGVQFGVEFKY
jgi:hypothetical protein